MAAADALVASATLVLGARSDKTARLPQVIDALYKEFGKDECRAVKGRLSWWRGGLGLGSARAGRGAGWGEGENVDGAESNSWVVATR